MSMTRVRKALYDIGVNLTRLKAAFTGNATAITDVTTANATDLATAQALTNANKAKINALLAELRLRGIIG